MRRRVLGVLAAMGVAAVACVDLFHSTDFDTLCTLDASAPGCSEDGATIVDAGVVPDLCADGGAEALTRAKRACALLGACETPIGQNKAGLCLANAILAYDCVANKERRPINDSATFWRCMAAARTCDAVDKCAAPLGVQSCASGSAFEGCTSGDASTRIQCQLSTDPKGTFESCAVYGQRCAAVGNNDHSQCVGAHGFACTTSGCIGPSQYLALCDDAGTDRGLDCAQVGAGTCVFGAPYGCKPQTSTTCATSAGITCNSDVATGCLTGFAESVDCKALTGKGTCVPISGALAVPGTTPSNACQGDAGCMGDTCSGRILHACVQGAIVDVDCADAGMGNCTMTPTLEEGSSAACTPQ